MKIEKKDIRSYIGNMLYWDDISNRYVITRSGVLDDVYKGQLSFDGQQDYKPFKAFTNLRGTEEL